MSHFTLARGGRACRNLHHLVSDSNLISIADTVAIQVQERDHGQQRGALVAVVEVVATRDHLSIQRGQLRDILETGRK